MKRTDETESASFNQKHKEPFNETSFNKTFMNFKRCEVSFDLPSKTSEEEKVTQSVCIYPGKKPN
jgi:hypothetical protein